MESCGNSTSTTGPVTRATRPTPTAPVCRCVRTASAVLMALRLPVVSSSGERVRAADDRCVSASAGERVRAADDLRDLLRDLLLPRVVREAGVLTDELV